MSWTVGSLTDEDYASIEEAAYEAAVLPELWPSALTYLNDLTGTAGTLMVTVSDHGARQVTTPNMDEVGRRFVDENWMQRNSRRRLAIEKGIVGIGRFAVGEELFAPGEQEVDPLTTELFRPHGFGRVAGFIVDLPHGDSVIMNVEQYYDRGPIGEEILARLNSLYPVLARAATAQGRGWPGFRLPSTLTAVGHLTPAEVDVARAIASGQRIEQIAVTRRTSVATVRNQLRSAMSKTGVFRRGVSTPIGAPTN